jgi:hypothetical protein
MDKEARHQSCVWLCCILFAVILCGCSSFEPGCPAEQRRFLYEHPGATITAMSNNDATEHSHSATQGHSDWTFVYRYADGAEHEEVWHYIYENHGWNFVGNQRIR